MKENKSYIKGVVLFLILLLPSILYLLLTTGKHNFLYLPTIVKEGNSFVVDKTGKNTTAAKHIISDFKLNNIEGGTFGIDDLKGSINLIGFMPDDCEIFCQTSHYKLKTEILDKLSLYNNLQIIIYVIPQNGDLNFDPKVYREVIGASGMEKWKFVTGAKDQLMKMAKNEYFVGPIGEITFDGDELKSDYTVIVDKIGQLRTGQDNDGKNMYAYSLRSQYEINYLLDDLKLLMAEYQKESKKKD